MEIREQRIEPSYKAIGFRARSPNRFPVRAESSLDYVDGGAHGVSLSDAGLGMLILYRT